MKSLISKPTHLTLFIHSLVLGALVITMVLSGQQSTKLGYINTNEVFEGFALTQELEARFDQVKNQRQALLDSMRLDLQVMSNALQNGAPPEEKTIALFNQKKEAYLHKEQEFAQSNQDLMGQYNDQIAKQINQYVKEYGQKQGFQFIYGADGTGSLMYAGEGENVTKETIAFINKRFQGLASK